MKGEVNDTLRDRVHAPCTLKSESVQGGVHAFARLHAQKDSRPPTVAKLARRLKPGRSNASRRVHSAKVLISSGIWWTISENPCQKISKYSPNLTKYKHTKRVRVQSKQGNTSPSPQNDQIGPEGGEGVHTPRKRVHACTLSMLTRERRTTERKDLEK
jgi:hypothetical protein